MSQHGTASALTRLAWMVGIAALLASAPLAEARAEQAWVRGEVRLNVRSGPGTQFRILTGVATGQPVRILQREPKWTKVRLDDGKSGWIPVGYLAPEPPPTVRLEQIESELVETKAQLETAKTQVNDLGEKYGSTQQRATEQQSEIDVLTMENMELRAGARWPEWITGASILVTGMLVGALLHRNSSRRPSSRIRL